jgi:hypothetical protein
MWHTFSGRVACIAISVAMLAPLVYDFLGGSILRSDWLFALGMAACCLKLRRYKTAGVLLAYAIASKPFSAMFALALGMHFVLETLRRRRPRREHVELVVASVIGLVAIVAVSSLLLADAAIWNDYISRILVTLQEKYYAGNHSFRDVFLQLTLDGPRALLDPTPEPVAASLQQVQIQDYGASFALARLLLLALLVLVIARHRDEVFAFGIGALFVYVVFVTNRYYWQMLLLPALGFAQNYRSDRRTTVYLVYLCLFLMASYLFVHYAAIAHLQGYFGSWWLFWLCLFMPGMELWVWLRDRRKAPASQAPEPQ